MLYIDDGLPRHPKILKAGGLLGGVDGPARALALFMDGLAYSRTYGTDGVVPDRFVAGSSLVGQPIAIAKTLVRVRLWHRIRGGYQIHDYHDWNKSARDIDQVRAKWREKKAAQRRGGNGAFGLVYSLSPMLSPGDSPSDANRDSRARVPRSTYVLGTTGHDRTVPFCVLPDVLTGRFASGLLKTQEKKTAMTTKRPIDFRTLCAIARAVFDRTVDDGEWIERVKRRLVAQGYAYPWPHELTAAIRAVDVAIQKRRSA